VIFCGWEVKAGTVHFIYVLNIWVAGSSGAGSGYGDHHTNPKSGMAMLYQ